MNAIESLAAHRPFFTAKVSEALLESYLTRSSATEAVLTPPISFAATRGEFARDSDVCARSCDSPVALHVYKNPGEEPEDMVDLSGRPYAKLGNAFRHRVGYDPACKCRPHPWEESSRKRHSIYLQR